MQDPKNSNTRKPAWYQRAVKMASVWRSSSNRDEIPTKNATLLWRSSTTKIDYPIPNTSRSNKKLSKCSSLKIATTTFTRVCLCAPISSFKKADQLINFQIPPRRSNSYPRYSKSSTSSFPTLLTQDHGVNYNNIPNPTPRLSVEGGRRVFRGKSVRDDVLMRRFVVEEEAMMQIRRRNQMEAMIRRRCVMRRKKLGPSPLSRMVMAAGDDHDQEHAA